MCSVCWIPLIVLVPFGPLKLEPSLPRQRVSSGTWCGCWTPAKSWPTRPGRSWRVGSRAPSQEGMGSCGWWAMVNHGKRHPRCGLKSDFIHGATSVYTISLMVIYDLLGSQVALKGDKCLGSGIIWLSGLPCWTVSRQPPMTNSGRKNDDPNRYSHNSSASCYARWYHSNRCRMV